MIEINEKELKSKEIEILNYFNNYCEKNDIKYWLCYGTLLGAVRHKGYIPWDDDIDLGMLREDYDRLINTFNDENGKFDVISIEKDKKYHLPFAKVIMNDTLVIDGKYSIGINIDIFPYDYVKDDKDAKRRHKIEHIYAFLNYVKNDNSEPNYGMIKNLLIKTIKMIIKCLPDNYFVIRMNRFNIKNNKSKTNMVDSFCETNYKGYITSPLNINIFNELVKTKFEKDYYYVPKNYQEVLTNLYGSDYMQLPPVEKRWHHKQKAYIK